MKTLSRLWNKDEDSIDIYFSAKQRSCIVYMYMNIMMYQSVTFPNSYTVKAIIESVKATILTSFNFVSNLTNNSRGNTFLSLT